MGFFYLSTQYIITELQENYELLASGNQIKSFLTPREGTRFDSHCKISMAESGAKRQISFPYRDARVKMLQFPPVTFDDVEDEVYSEEYFFNF